MGAKAIGPATSIVLAAIILAGCGMNSPMGGDPNAPAFAQVEENARSQTIENLMARPSVIQPGSPFDAVAKAVLATHARTAEAELRSARLRARAASKNWLPRIGPNISLTSMSDLVVQLLVEQVIFDNGRRKAEREFAAYDVEAAAVALSQDTNARVATALKLHISATRAQHQGSVAAKAQRQMREFADIIERRVNGGVSNMADLRVVQAKLNEATADLHRAREAEQTARAELAAMVGVPADRFKGVNGIGGLTHTGVQGRNPLKVLLAVAEGRRSVARTKMDRAAQLPSVIISGAAGEDGNIGVGVGGNRMAGIGLGDSLAALRASQDAANRSIKQTQEDNQRVVNRLEQKRQSLQRQQAESAKLVADAKRTYNLFLEQFRNSGRPIMEVVNIYENAMRLEKDAVRLKYELAEIQVEIANLYGTLVSGDKI